MANFFRYLTSGPEDKEWGIYLTVGGRYTSAPYSVYPQKTHPSGYYFDWANGRCLNEYQILFITEGKGVLETSSATFNIGPGSLMIIEPDKWHRYRPDPDTGWTEYYIGFDGKMVSHFIANTFNSLDEKPIHSSKNQLEILDSYQKILDLVSTQKPGYHQIASGLIIKLLGYMKAQMKADNFDEIQIEVLVNNAKNYIWEHVHENADLKQFAKSQSVSYSYFRKMFKLYTGIAPHQFYLELKIMRAKELIVAGDKSVKEITYDLGFDSIQYFSRLFKKKTGVSPSQFRSGG